MNESSVMLFSVLVYKVAAILTGLAIAYFGYRLFQTGVYEKASELKAAWGDKHLGLKSSAPGIFFSLFGTAIVATTVMRGIDIETSNKGAGNAADIFTGLATSDEMTIQLSQSLKNSLAKVARGEKLDSEEQSELQEWLSSVDQRIHIRAYIDNKRIMFQDVEIAKMKALNELLRRRAEAAEEFAARESVTPSVEQLLIPPKEAG